MGSKVVLRRSVRSISFLKLTFFEHDCQGFSDVSDELTGSGTGFEQEGFKTGPSKKELLPMLCCTSFFAPFFSIFLHFPSSTLTHPRSFFASVCCLFFNGISKSSVIIMKQIMNLEGVQECPSSMKMEN